MSIIYRLLSKSHRVLIISPHCDDAAFSIGELIYEISRLEIELIILTCFSKSRYAINQPLLGVEDITLIRKSEDKLFYKLCNANSMQFIYLDLMDAPLRTDRINDTVFDPILRADDMLLAKIIKNTIKSLLTTDTLLLFPMATGSHIDHVITNIACHDIANSHDHYGVYLDQPYVTLKETVSVDFRINKFDVITYSINKNIKRRIIDCYLSQRDDEERKAMLSYGSEIVIVPYVF